jgi:hypothetical protein
MIKFLAICIYYLMIFVTILSYFRGPKKTEEEIEAERYSYYISNENDRWNASYSVYDRHLLTMTKYLLI